MAIVNLYYWRDQDYPDFFWIRSTYANVCARHPQKNEICAVDVMRPSTFLVQNFLPNLEDICKRSLPTWAAEYRQGYLAFMRKRSGTVKRGLSKPNPALPILQRLSGLDEAKLREIISF